MTVCRERERANVGLSSTRREISKFDWFHNKCSKQCGRLFTNLGRLAINFPRFSSSLWFLNDSLSHVRVTSTMKIASPYERFNVWFIAVWWNFPSAINREMLFQSLSSHLRTFNFLHRFSSAREVKTTASWDENRSLLIHLSASIILVSFVAWFGVKQIIHFLAAANFHLKMQLNKLGANDNAAADVVGRL